MDILYAFIVIVDLGGCFSVGFALEVGECEDACAGCVDVIDRGGRGVGLEGFADGCGAWDIICRVGKVCKYCESVTMWLLWPWEYG